MKSYKKILYNMNLLKKNDVNIVCHVILKYNLTTFFKCESDGTTPTDLVRLNLHWQMWDLSYEFEHHKTLKENYEEFASEQQKDKIFSIKFIFMIF
jgi:hypothetical protein